MTPIKRNLLYIFRDSLLRLRISWDHGKILTLSVGYHVERTDSRGKSKWDGNRCVKNTTHGKKSVPAATINKKLESLEDKIEKAFYQFEMEDKMPSVVDLKSILAPKMVKQKPISIEDLEKEYINEQSILSQWSSSTIRLTKQAIANIKEVFGGKATLSNLEDSDIVRLITHMTQKECFVFKRESPEDAKRAGYNNETINRYLTRIRAFVKWCESKGYATNCSLSKPIKQLSTTRIPVVYLTIEEIEKIRRVKATPVMQEVKECFIFCCFTGLRYSDISALKWSQIKENHIEVVTKKTHDLLTIELNEFSREILNSRQRGNDDENVFRVICNSDYNKAIKKMAKEAGIDSIVQVTYYTGKERRITNLPKWHYVTSHTPRRTFVTNALSLGIPTAVIMKWTGHKTLKALQPYMDIVNKAKMENMDLFSKLKKSME